MKVLSRSSGCVVAALLVLAISQARAADPYGVWLTESGNGHVEIYPCAIAANGPICAKVIWLKDAVNPDKSRAKSMDEVRDVLNEDPALRNRKILGLEFMSGFQKSPDEKDVWSDGHIYNAEDGKTYRARITVLDDKTLRLRGYVIIPLLGKTEIWQRVR
jgi:uncharacterized protein (DUF2147 family)